MELLNIQFLGMDDWRGIFSWLCLVFMGTNEWNRDSKGEEAVEKGLFEALSFPSFADFLGGEQYDYVYIS